MLWVVEGLMHSMYVWGTVSHRYLVYKVYKVPGRHRRCLARWLT